MRTAAPVHVAEREARLPHETEEAAIRLSSGEGETIEQELVQGIVNQRGVVGLRQFGGGVHDAVRRAEQDVEDADLGTAAIPRVALRHRYRARSPQDEANCAGLVLEGQVIGDRKAG